LSDSFGVNERADFSKRVILWDKIANLNRMKHSFLSVRDSHHRFSSSGLSAIRSLIELFYHFWRWILGVFQQTVRDSSTIKPRAEAERKSMEEACA
jgi:hypothetical protein